MRKDFINYLNKTLQDAKGKGNNLIISSTAGMISSAQPMLLPAEYFPKIKEAIIGAESEVLINSCIIDAGSEGEQLLLEALGELSDKAVKQGKKIRVRILINRRKGIASYFKSNPKNNALRKKDFSEFPGLDIQYVEHRHKAFGSYNSKEFIIDSKVAILVSGDLTSVHNASKDKQSWIDIATVVQGSQLVQAMRKNFVQAWESKATKPLAGKKVTFSDQPLELPGAAQEKPAQINALYFAKKANGNIFSQESLSPYAIAVITALNEAEDSIEIVTPNLNSKEIILALAAANARGVTIKIVIGKYHNDSSENKPLIGGNNREGINTLLAEINKRGNEHPNKLNIHWAAKDNTLIPEGSRQSLHAKLIIVDDVVFTGSSVPDRQSVHHSREGDICIQSQKIANDYREKIFNPIYEQGICFKSEIAKRQKFKKNSESLQKNNQVIEQILNRNAHLQDEAIKHIRKQSHVIHKAASIVNHMGSNSSSGIMSCFLVFERLRYIFLPTAIFVHVIISFVQVIKFLRNKNKNAGSALSLGISLAQFGLVTFGSLVGFLGLISYSVLASIAIIVSVGIGTLYAGAKTLWNIGKLIAHQLRGSKVGNNYDAYIGQKETYKQNIKREGLSFAIGAATTAIVGIIMLTKIGAIAIATTMGTKLTIGSLTNMGAASITTVTSIFPNLGKAGRFVIAKVERCYNFIKKKLGIKLESEIKVEKELTEAEQKQLLCGLEKLSFSKQTLASATEIIPEAPHPIPYIATKDAVIGAYSQALIAKSISQNHLRSEVPKQNHDLHINIDIAKDILLTQLQRKVTELQQQITSHPDSWEKSKRQNKIDGLKKYIDLINDPNSNLDDFRKEKQENAKGKSNVYHSFFKIFDPSDYESLENAVEAYYIKLEATSCYTKLKTVFAAP
jgi:phosphatidylserine/phosphatidylglycerophosphate/cardiolipin synthase-like enzyme